MPNNLSEPELAVWSSFPRGAWVDLRVGDVSLDNVCDGGAWSADRIVRAEVMRALLLGACPAEPGYTAALRLRGARITGYLDLQGGTLNHALVCEECVFDYPVCLAEATVRTVRLKGTHLPRFDGMRASVAGMLSLQNAVIPDGVRLDYATISGGVRLRGAAVGSARDGLAVSAEGVRVDGGLECDEEFSVLGEVLLRNAHIGGSVKMATARISHPGNAALDADMLTVVGELDCTRITIEGESRIRNANIGGPLLLSAACLRNPEGSALRAIRMNIDGGMWCSDGFQAEGEIHLVAAHMGGSLSFNAASLSNAHGPALNADRASFGSLDGDGLAVSEGELRFTGTNITGNLSLDQAALGRGADGVSFAMDNATVAGTLWMQGLRASGEIRVRNCQIGGRVLFRVAELNNPGGYALRLTRDEVASDMVCTGLAAVGEVRLVDSHFGHDVYMDRISLANPGKVALDARSLRATELIFLPEKPVEGTVILDHARLGLLRDDPAYWPGCLRLDGLSYETLEPNLPARERLPWLARALDHYQPQPYEQLAAVYAKTGQRSEARRVLYARERHYRNTRPLPGRIWSTLQDVTVGYGYMPGRAALWLAALLTIGSIIFAIHPPAPLQNVGVPHFNSVIYTFDLMLPLVSLGQKTAYNPAGAEQWLSYFLVAAGWILATTIIAGITRILTRR